MALKYLLDTDTLSFVVSNRHPEVRKTFLEHSHESGISVITYAEALFGVRKKKAVKLESLIGVFCDMIEIRPFTDAMASAYADIRAQLESDGTPIGAMDMEIATGPTQVGARCPTPRAKTEGQNPWEGRASSRPQPRDDGTPKRNHQRTHSCVFGFVRKTTKSFEQTEYVRCVAWRNQT